MKCPQPARGWGVVLCATTATLALGCSDNAVVELTPESAVTADCVVATAGAGFVSVAVPDATVLATVTFNATPSALNIDAVIGLSAGPATRFSDLAAAVRFAPSGVLDARDADGYRADLTDPYTVRSIDIRIIADLTSHTYSVFRGPWQEGREIARQYRFRSQQSAVTHLDHLALIVDSPQGSVTVCTPRGVRSTGVAYSKEGNYRVAPLTGNEAVIWDATSATWLDARGQAVAQLGHSGPFASDGAGNVVTATVSGTTLTVDKLGPGFATIWTTTATVPADAVVGVLSIDPGGGVLASAISAADRATTVSRFTAAGAFISQASIPGTVAVIDSDQPIVLSNDSGSLAITRHLATGEVVWSKTFTGQSGISAVAVDPSHNLVFGGELFTPVDFGGGTLPLQQTDDGKLNAFVVKLSPAGEHVFSLKTGYTHIGGIATDGARVLVSGTRQTQFHSWHLQAFGPTGAPIARPSFQTGFGADGFGGEIAIGPSGRLWWNLQTQWPFFPKWPYLVAADG